MTTLLLQLNGPMQSWGTVSRFDERDTGKEPSKSGVLGLLAAAMGIDRGDWQRLEPLSRLRMGVRHDRTGTLKRDYHTAKNVVSADQSKIHATAVSSRYYLADAAFLVGLESSDRTLLESVHAALRDPAWPLFLGRKSYVPAEPVWMPDGLQTASLRKALTSWPWIGARKLDDDRPERLLYSWETDDGFGAMRMDQPISCFNTRRFGSRFVLHELIASPKEAHLEPV